MNKKMGKIDHRRDEYRNYNISRKIGIIISCIYVIHILFSYQVFAESSDYFSGESAFSRGDYQLAEEKLNKIFESSVETPGWANSALLLGKIYAKTDRPANAAAVFLKIYQARPGDPLAPESLRLLSEALQQARRPEKACQVLQEAKSAFATMSQYQSGISADFERLRCAEGASAILAAARAMDIRSQAPTSKLITALMEADFSSVPGRMRAFKQTNGNYLILEPHQSTEIRIDKNGDCHPVIGTSNPTSCEISDKEIKIIGEWNSDISLVDAETVVNAVSTSDHGDEEPTRYTFRRTGSVGSEILSADQKELEERIKEASNRESERRNAEMQETRRKIAERSAAEQAASMEATGAMIDMIESVSANFRSQANRRVPQPQVNNPYTSSPQSSPTPPKSAGAFGALPEGVGTQQQRQFWASRCQNQANDGSSAAQGCQQTLNTLKGQPAQVAQATRAPPLNVGGLSQNGRAGGSTMGTQIGQMTTASGNTHPELIASQCIATKPGSRGTLVNRCGYTVQYTFCVANSGNAFACPNMPNSNGHYDMGSGSLGPGAEDSAPALGQNDNAQTSLRIISFACRGALGTVLPFLTSLNPLRGQCR